MRAMQNKQGKKKKFKQFFSFCLNRSFRVSQSTAFFSASGFSYALGKKRLKF